MAGTIPRMGNSWMAGGKCKKLGGGCKVRRGGGLGSCIFKEKVEGEASTW